MGDAEAGEEGTKASPSSPTKAVTFGLWPRKKELNRALKGRPSKSDPWAAALAMKARLVLPASLAARATGKMDRRVLSFILGVGEDGLRMRGEGGGGLYGYREQAACLESHLDTD